MTVSAGSNSEGAFRQYWDSTVLRDGKPVPVKLFRSYWSKSPTVHGDHTSVYPYHRHIQSVVSDVPFVNTREDWFSHHMFVDSDYISGFYPLPYINPPDKYGGYVDNARAKAITEALNKLRSGSVQNGADIGEARTTANMIASTASQLLAALRAVRRGNFSIVPKILGMSRKDVLSGRSAANRWLEYQYGWKPLMGSIHDNMKLLQSRMKNGSPGSVRVVRRVRGDFPEVVYGRAQRESFIQTWGGDYEVEVGLRANVTSQFLSTADTFGLVNPLSIAWELVPLSFVIDWFIPIGNTLSALSSTLGLSFTGGWISTRTTPKLRTVWNMEIPTTVDNSGDFQWVDFTFDRQRLTNFPMPELYGKTNPFSTSHIASALALIRQLI